MTSYEIDIGEKARAGSRFLADVRDEIQKAFFTEKKRRGFTQQAIANRLGVHRSVVNRQVMGLENLTARSIGELLWAIGWSPHFEVQDPMNDFGSNARLSPIRIETGTTAISQTASTKVDTNFTIRAK